MKLLVVFLITLFTFATTAFANKYVVSNQKVTFHEGYIRCRTYGMDPAEILSECDHKELLEALPPHKELGYINGFWIFATNILDRATFIWMKSNKPLFYSLFSITQPDVMGTKGNCLEIYQHNIGIFLWSENNCETKLRFVCQRKDHNSTSSCKDNNVELKNNISN
ncbi:hypothetical protein GWI33_013252 [Rhynchophorus ferrugineus]|uniref:C-type lectin domain-containing protein n=1 Tax=Rhynchophorus ferrugineus TaxID=354439 RepID=A0A834I4Z0_RHYFE|nr:hypothetical protein GWI33_013252 [Rhynchophorus ferrugineus]